MKIPNNIKHIGEQMQAHKLQQLIDLAKNKTSRPINQSSNQPASKATSKPAHQTTNNTIKCQQQSLTSDQQQIAPIYIHGTPELNTPAKRAAIDPDTSLTDVDWCVGCNQHIVAEIAGLHMPFCLRKPNAQNASYLLKQIKKGIKVRQCPKYNQICKRGMSETNTEEGRLLKVNCLQRIGRLVGVH